MSAEPETGAELDEDGLVIQKYVSRVLVVLPSAEYAEQTLRHARSSLYNVHVGTYSVATDSENLIQGRLQDEFQVDAPLQGASLEGFAGVIFVGGEGATELFDNPDALRLAREADSGDMLIGAWGHSVGILAKAGILKGRRVTGCPAVAEILRSAKARYTGRQLERDGKLVTATDEAVGIRFGKALAQVVGI